MFASMQSSAWAYPVLEVVHITGIALLLGNLVLLELRVFGWGRNLPVPDLARLSLGLVGLGFGLTATSGLLMFVSQAAELLANRAFTTKMLLLLAAGANAGWFHARDSLRKLDGIARSQMLLSTILWIVVIVFGRWIAYL